MSQETFKKIGDPHQIFKFARQFDQAQSLLAQIGITSNDQMLIPAMVHLALAFELYLKCLIFLDTGQPERKEHNYKKLFKKLTPNTQSKVKAIFDRLPKSPMEAAASLDEKFSEEIRNYDHSLEGVLSSSGDAFIKFRYMYEGRMGPGEGFTAIRAKYAVIEEIRNRHPEWF